MDWHKKSSIAMWQYIDPLKVNLILLFCTKAIYHIKTTHIAMLYLFYLVNLTCLVAPTDE